MNYLQVIEVLKAMQETTQQIMLSSLAIKRRKELEEKK